MNQTRHEPRDLEPELLIRHRALYRAQLTLMDKVHCECVDGEDDLFFTALVYLKWDDERKDLYSFEIFLFKEHGRMFYAIEGVIKPGDALQAVWIVRTAAPELLTCKATMDRVLRVVTNVASKIDPE
jgi:hypothetical protein